MVESQEGLKKVELNLDLKVEKISVQYLAHSSISFIQQLIDVLSGLKQEKSSINDFLAFEWSFEAKEVGILLREASLNVLKLYFYKKDGLRSDTDVKAYNDELVSTINIASSELISNYKSHLSTKKKPNEDWLFQTEPAEKVVVQLQIIIDQIKKIQRSQHKLDQIDTRLHDFKSLYESYIGERYNVITQVKKSTEELVAEANILAENISIKGVKKLTTIIDKKIETIDARPLMSSYDEIHLDDIEKLSLPIRSNDGMLETKSIDVLSEVSSWVSFNIASKLREVDKAIVLFYEQAGISLFQLSNRLKARIIDEETEINVTKSDFVNPIEKLDSQLSKLNTEVVKTNLSNVAMEFNKNLVISQMFSYKESFLPQSKLNTVSSLTLTTSLAERYSRERWATLWSEFKSSIIPKKTKNYPEDTTDVVKFMTQFNPVSDTNTLFMRKGFLGTSFTVPRRVLEDDMHKHFEKWKEGYGGGLLIQGPVGSGKSNLIGKLQLILEDLPSYNITPNQSIDVKGYKFLMSSNLAQAIKTIVKFQNVSRCIMIIDHLESYINNPEQGFDLLEQLFDLIRKNSNRMYFIVACNNRLYAKMQSFLDVNNVFTKVINSDKITDQTIREALVTRALAVANHEDINYDTDVFFKKAKLVTSICEGNIGYAMQLWCIINDDTMGYRLPSEFKNTILRHRYLLKVLLSFGAIHMGTIIKMYDDHEQQKVRSDISYLLQSKIVNRPTEGFIAINELLKHPIDKILTQ